MTLGFSLPPNPTPDFEDFLKKSDWRTFGTIASGLPALEKVVFGLGTGEDLSRLRGDASFVDECLRQSGRWKLARWRYGTGLSNVQGWCEVGIDSGANACIPASLHICSYIFQENM